jgi:hypothetical protein
MGGVQDHVRVTFAEEMHHGVLVNNLLTLNSYRSTDTVIVKTACPAAPVIETSFVPSTGLVPKLYSGAAP